MPTKLSRLPAGDPEDGEEEEEGRGDPSAILWTGAPRRTPIICFHPEAILTKESALRSTGERYRLAYKMVRTDSRLVRGLLSAHGFHEVNANSNDFNLMWTGSHVKPHVLRGLASFQKVNHFPRSYELTRKDRLYKNVQRMQQTHGQRHFNLLPQTYLLPGEYQEFCNAFSKDRGPWIIKPVASSRGRGVYLVNSPSQVSMEDNILVSRYLSNPLLIDGFKFDVRLYVLITSYDPLVIYLYEEGLTRFATVRYDRTPKNIKNQFMHLTNYSVNKKSGDYVSCDDPEVEDYGNKWSMSAMLRYLKQEGKDTEGLMSQVEDLIIKTIISGELHIAAACKAFLPHRGNCFELYGFDVLIDNNMKPWLLEVNLSPSLACDAPLDLKVKACVIADMLTLVGLECQDPQQRPGRVGGMASNKKGALKSQKQRPLSASDIDTELQPGTRTKTESWTRATLGLSTEEVKVLRRVQEEAARRGGFVRIFPRADTWALYGSFLEYKTSMNHMLAMRLFPDRTTLNHSRDHRPKIHAALYERKLVSLQMRRARKHRAPRRRGLASESSEEEEDEGEEDNSEEELEEVPEPPPLEAEVAPLEAEVAPLEAEVPPLALPLAPPRVSILEALQKGENLSKVQARWAFSTYLQRVQNRLQSKVEPEKPPPKEEEQMELVMRFLQRAASNLQQSLPLRLPARSASAQEKRHLLARQLGDFITLYNQETHQMSPAEPPGVNSAEFQAFIDGSSECELEEVLTFYTHKNKSASIFLGSSVPRGGQQAGDQDRRGESADLRSGQQGGSPSQNVEGGGSHAISSASVSVTKVSSDLSAGLHSGPPSIQNEQRASSPTKGSSLFSSANSDAWVQPVSRPSSTTSTLGTISSFQSAAQIYSQRLSRPSSSRPASGQSSALRTRCRSAGTVRGELEDPYNVGAVTASLQRLAERQASRQTFSQLRQLTQQLTHLNLTSKVRIHQASAPMPRGRMAAHTAAEHTDPGARNGTQEARLAWDSETESSTCPPLPGAPSAAASNLPPAGQSLGTDQSARLQPTPPPAQRGIVSRKLSASRLVRVAIPEGHHPAAEAGDTGCLTQGAPESPQMIFARSRPPVPPRTTIRMLKKDATVIHLR